MVYKWKTGFPCFLNVYNCVDFLGGVRILVVVCGFQPCCADFIYTVRILILLCGF